MLLSSSSNFQKIVLALKIFTTAPTLLFQNIVSNSVRIHYLSSLLSNFSQQYQLPKHPSNDSNAIWNDFLEVGAAEKMFKARTIDGLVGAF